MPENIPQTSTPPAGSGNGNASSVPQGTQPVPQAQTFSLAQKEQQTPQKSAFSFLKNLMQKEGPKENSGDQKNAASGNAFTQLFGKKDLEPVASPKPAQASEKKPEAAFQKPVAPVLPKTVLGPKAFLLKRQADEFREHRSLKIFKTACLALCGLSILSFTGLYFQLEPELALFGTSTVATRFAASNEKLEAAQTRTNELRFRTAAIHIARVNMLADTFLQDLETAGSARRTTAEKLAAQARLGEQRETFKQSLKVMVDMFRPSLAPAVRSGVQEDPLEREKNYESLLRQYLEEKKKNIPQDTEQGVFEIRTLESLISLAQNRSLRSFLKNVNSQTLDDSKMKEILVRIRDQWNDDLSLIAQLKAQQPKWTEVLDRFHTVTLKVDKLYGKGLFEQIGGIQYSNYDFNADAGVLTVNGNVKTEDTKTFTMMADLVEALEKSSYFKNVEMRDFAKAKTSDTSGFSGSINLKIQLQKPDEKDPRDEIIPLTIAPL